MFSSQICYLRRKMAIKQLQQFVSNNFPAFFSLQIKLRDVSFLHSHFLLLPKLYRCFMPGILLPTSRSRSKRLLKSRDFMSRQIPKITAKKKKETRLICFLYLNFETVFLLLSFTLLYRLNNPTSLRHYTIIFTCFYASYFFNITTDSIFHLFLIRP